MSYELVRLIGIQVIVGRWVVSREFLYSVHGLFETFNGFQPARASRRVVFENLVSNRIAHYSSHGKRLVRTWSLAMALSRIRHLPISVLIQIGLASKMK